MGQKKKKKSREEMSNQQSAAIMSTSSTKQDKLTFQIRTNTQPLALDGQRTTATESRTIATTKHAIVLSYYHHLRVAQLNNNRNLYNTTLEALRTQPLAMLLVVSNLFDAVILITTTPSSCSHACVSAVG